MMEELRKYPRYNCNIAVDFEFHEGNPDDFDIGKSTPIKGKGTIMDWSKGGVMIVSKARVGVGLPINLSFKTKKKRNILTGVIVRTGLILNNPSEVAQRMKAEKVKGDAYIGVKFENLIEDIDL